MPNLKRAAQQLRLLPEVVVDLVRSHREALTGDLKPSDTFFSVNSSATVPPKLEVILQRAADAMREAGRREIERALTERGGRDSNGTTDGLNPLSEAPPPLPVDVVDRLVAERVEAFGERVGLSADDTERLRDLVDRSVVDHLASGGALDQRLRVTGAAERRQYELYREYRQEVELSQSLQEKARRERAELFSATVPAVAEALQSVGVAPEQSAAWLHELVESYGRSLDASTGLGLHPVVASVQITPSVPDSP